jgi:hypothetical protein
LPACCSRQSPASAQIISVNFDNNLDFNAPLMESTDLAGAPGVRVGNWNAWVKNDTAVGDAGQTIVDSSGATVAGFTASGNFAWASRDNDTVNDTAMFSDIVDVQTSTRLVDVSGVPYSAYDVYVYMHDDDFDRAGQFTLGSETFYMRGFGPGEHAGDPLSNGTGYVISTDTTLGLGTDIDQGNYVKFSNVTDRHSRWRGLRLTRATVFSAPKWLDFRSCRCPSQRPWHWRG